MIKRSNSREPLDPEKLRVTVGKRIRAEREGKGLTRKALGKLIDAAETTISFWEAGRRMPDLHTLCVLSSVFGCSLDYLAGMTDIRERRIGEFDPRLAEIHNRASRLTPDTLKVLEGLLEWLHRVDKDKRLLKDLEKRGEEELK